MTVAVASAVTRSSSGITVRPARARGHANHGWLDSFHTFSFADYYDPQHMGFRALRVINDDVIAPGTGFGMHGHRDMEIISYVVRGALAHEDTTGGKGVIRRGEVQYMSAGTGVRHSEHNPSADEDVRLLQIWIQPFRQGLPPSYHQSCIPEDAKLNALTLVASPDGADGSLTTHRDVRVYATVLESGWSVSYRLGADRGAWIQMVDGSVSVNGIVLSAGDGAAIEGIKDIVVTASGRSELVLFDLD